MLRGRWRGRHFEKIAAEPDHLIIEPTIDRSFAPGDASTISDHRDNIHWFEAQTDTAFIFNVHVTGYERTGGAPGRVYLDPHGEALPGGRIRAPRLTATECVARYGG